MISECKEKNQRIDDLVLKKESNNHKIVYNVVKICNKKNKNYTYRQRDFKNFGIMKVNIKKYLFQIISDIFKITRTIFFATVCSDTIVSERSKHIRYRLLNLNYNKF